MFLAISDPRSCLNSEINEVPKCIYTFSVKYIVSKNGNPVMQYGSYRFSRHSDYKKGSENPKCRWICMRTHKGCRAAAYTFENKLIKIKNNRRLILVYPKKVVQSSNMGQTDTTATAATSVGILNSFLLLHLDKAELSSNAGLIGTTDIVHAEKGSRDAVGSA
ncbi:Uncharacterized protein OBRU01_13768 [Operophtera brumata]|uniref:Uncharacterized protein n=1 Tax=Operophtera brumata TaxID=104452 RepID=A0A0L7L7D0_OPEBR|nr:Uncharacterized protein OBRU01_13768 [Operophtera brumata]